MKEKLEKLFQKHHFGHGEYDRDSIIKELLIFFKINQIYCNCEEPELTKLTHSGTLFCYNCGYNIAPHEKPKS